MYNYNGYYPQQQFQMQMPGSIKGRPVSSIDEAKAAPIDFDGSVSYFPDIANGKIYTKNINLDGTASMKVYELKVAPVVEEKVPEYVTKEDLNKAIDELRKSLVKPTKAKDVPKAVEDF